MVPLLTLTALLLLGGAILLAERLERRRVYKQASVLLERRDYAQAEHVYRRWLMDDPESVEAHAGLAQALLGRESWAEAAVQFELLLEGQPEYPGAHLGLGRCRYALNQHTQALANLEQAIALDDARGEANGEALYLVATLLHAERRFIEAESALRRAIDEHARPGSAQALLGRILHDQGRTPEGLALLDATLAEYPREAQVHFQLGEVHRERGAAATATAAYRTARELGCEVLACDLGLALALRDSGQRAEALRVLGLLTRKHEREPEPWFELGRMRETDNEGDSALLCYERCLALDRKHARAKAGVLRMQRTADR